MLLLRHGACTDDYPADPGLTFQGRSQVESRAMLLRGAGIREIVHSGKRRAVETAALVAALVRVDRTRVVPELREVAPVVFQHPSADMCPDCARAVAVCETMLRHWIGRHDLLVVSHHNLLLFALRYLAGPTNVDPFFDFCSGVNLFQVSGHAAQTKWLALPVR